LGSGNLFPIKIYRAKEIAGKTGQRYCVMKKTIMITGASSGIGEACARLLSADGHRLILTGRRLERLERLREELIKAGDGEILVMGMDVVDRSAVESGISNLPLAWKTIDVLINNAGLALGLSGIAEGDPGQWDQMIDTNVKGLLYVSRAVIPLMVERRQGQIINIGSIAGRETYPNGNVYCATKHAVNSLTKGMRLDLLQHGIRVSQISPGAAETEFSLVRFQGDAEKAKSVYSGFRPLVGEDVALAVKFAIDMPAHANVDDLLLMPSAQASATVIRRDESQGASR
jgi:3-hydroxy acid dehydrogenase / malonic semialdehyde reductase